MMVLTLFIVFLLSGSLVPSGIPSAGAVDFAADQTIRTDGHVYRGSLYHRDDMWRIEHNNPGSIEVTIVRKDKGLIWLLQGRIRQFATMPFDDSADVMLDRTLARETDRERIGTEVLDGHPTTLFQVTVRDGNRDVVYYQMVGRRSSVAASACAARRRLGRSVQEREASLVVPPPF